MCWFHPKWWGNSKRLKKDWRKCLVLLTKLRSYVCAYVGTIGFCLQYTNSELKKDLKPSLMEKKQCNYIQHNHLLVVADFLLLGW